MHCEVIMAAYSALSLEVNCEEFASKVLGSTVGVEKEKIPWENFGRCIFTSSSLLETVKH